MAAAVILEFDGVGKTQYDAVNAKLGLDPNNKSGAWPTGLRSHVGGSGAGGGFAVFEVWDSQAEQTTWMQGRLGAALGEIGVPAPKRVEWFDVVGYFAS